MSTPGFVAIYRWRIAPEAEQAFTQQWHDVTLDIRDHFGGLGSCLTRDENGDYVGIALWPSLAARDSAWTAHGEPEPHPGITMVSETRLTVLDDLWLASARNGDSSQTSLAPPASRA